MGGISAPHAVTGTSESGDGRGGEDDGDGGEGDGALGEEVRGLVV